MRGDGQRSRGFVGQRPSRWPAAGRIGVGGQEEGRLLSCLPADGARILCASRADAACRPPAPAAPSRRPPSQHHPMSKAASKAKAVAARLRLLIGAGAAKPAPPVGPALGQAGVNIMAFCKDFNAATSGIKVCWVLVGLGG